MEFVKEVVYLGSKDMIFKDGNVLVTVSLYVDNSPIEVNVLSSNVPVMGVVRTLAFGDKVSATFTLRKVDKLYKLSLSALANV